MMTPPGDTDTTFAPPRSDHRVPFTILAVAVLVVWGWSVTFDFTNWDDSELICENPTVQNAHLANLYKIWTEPLIQIYMPLTYTLWMVESIPARALPKVPGTARHYELAPWIFHLVNVLVFVGVAFQAYRLIERLVGDRSAAVWGALFFSLHPLQNEAACWLSENKGLLAIFFGLSALGVFIDAVRSGSMKRYGWATLLYAIALSAKPWAVALPVMAVVIDFCFLSQPLLACVRRAALWVALAAAMVLITQRVQTGAEMSRVDLVKRPYIAMDAIRFYATKMIVPYPTITDYGRKPTTVLASANAPEVIGIAGLAGIALVLGMLALTGRWRTLGVAGLFFAALLPNLGFIPFVFQGLSTVADRYGSPALIAPALAIAYLTRWLGPSRQWFLALPLAALAGLSLVQCQVWKNNETLCTNTIAHNPRSASALINRSKSRYQDGDYEGSIRDAEQSIAVAPDFLPAYVNLCGSLELLGRHDDALQALDDALAVHPDYPYALEFKVYLLQYLKRYAQAIPPLSRLRELIGDTKSYRLRHARLLVLSGNSKEGLALFSNKPLSALERDFIEAQIFDQSQEFEAALKRYRFIVNHYSQNVEPAELRLAWLLATVPDANLRDPAEALAIAQRLSKKTRQATPAHLDTLSAALAATGDFRNALRSAEDARSAALARGDQKLAQEIAQRLALYQADQAYTIPPLKFLAPKSPAR